MRKLKYESFGRRLKAAREQAGWASAQRFAVAHGWLPATYRFWEQGKTMPHPADLPKLAKILHKPTDYLLEGLDKRTGTN